MSAPSGPSVPHCTHGTCTSTRLAQGCLKKKCRHHCVLDGPCRDNGHNTFFQRSSRGQGASIAVSARVSVPTSARTHTTPFDNDAFSSAFDGLYVDTQAPFHALAAHGQREAAQRVEDLRLLDLATGYKSPSPDVPVEHELEAHMIDQEERDLALAMQLSLASTSTSLAPSPLAGSSMLPDLSPSPDFPATLLSQQPPFIDLSSSPSDSLPAPIPALGRAQAPDATGNLPRKRAAASSTLARANRPPLRITTQLNPTWLGLGDGASAPASQSSTFHRFPLIYWDADDVPPQTIFVDSVPTWPIYILSNDDTTIQLLGTNISRLDLFCPKYRSWLSITVDFVHQVVSDTPIFLRRSGVSVRDEAETIERFLPGPAPHFRYNLADERRAVRTEYKKLGQLVIDDSGSESEVEVVRDIIDLSRSTKKRNGKKRARQYSDHSSPPPQQHPRTATSPSDSPPPSALFSASTPHSSSPDTSPPLTPATTTAPWPAAMFVIDMVEGFQLMASKELSGMKNRGTRFTHIFRREFRSSTYDDQIKKWKAVSPSLQQKALKAGRTEAGSWSVFCRAVREEQEQD
ncbi:hypothetical protein C8J57DRAFT_1243492 [Mycena rebaudengoi]|nr:hypothetical protein C8J57DRAFT_1243492 [Mycena rebaudengoi]